MEPNLFIFRDSRNSCNHFPRMTVVSRMIVMLNHLFWAVTRISIPEEIAIERQAYVQLRTMVGMQGVDECEEDREAFKRPASQQRRGLSKVGHHGLGKGDENFDPVKKTF